MICKLIKLSQQSTLTVTIETPHGPIGDLKRANFKNT